MLKINLVFCTIYSSDRNPRNINLLCTEGWIIFSFLKNDSFVLFQKKNETVVFKNEMFWKQIVFKIEKRRGHFLVLVRRFVDLKKIYVNLFSQNYRFFQENDRVVVSLFRFFKCSKRMVYLLLNTKNETKTDNFFQIVLK